MLGYVESTQPKGSQRQFPTVILADKGNVLQFFLEQYIAI